jgi:hypothetical protein
MIAATVTPAAISSRATARAWSVLANSVTRLPGTTP